MPVGLHAWMGNRWNPHHFAARCHESILSGFIGRSASERQDLFLLGGAALLELSARSEMGHRAELGVDSRILDARGRGSSALGHPFGSLGIDRRAFDGRGGPVVENGEEDRTGDDEHLHCCVHIVCHLPRRRFGRGGRFLSFRV